MAIWSILMISFITYFRHSFGFLTIDLISIILCIVHDQVLSLPVLGYFHLRTETAHLSYEYNDKTLMVKKRHQSGGIQMFVCVTTVAIARIVTYLEGSGLKPSCPSHARVHPNPECILSSSLLLWNNTIFL